MSELPEKTSEIGFTEVKSPTQPPSEWSPNFLTVGLAVFLIILIAIVTLALLGPTIGNVYSDALISL